VALCPVIRTVEGSLMTRFVGLDVSQEMTAVCAIDNAGRRLWRGQCASVPKQICDVVLRHAGDNVRIGIRSSSLQRLPVICALTGTVPVSLPIVSVTGTGVLHSGQVDET